MSDNPYAAPLAPVTFLRELPQISILGLSSMKVGIDVLIISWMPLTIFNIVGFVFGCASLMQRGEFASTP